MNNPSKSVIKNSQTGKLETKMIRY